MGVVHSFYFMCTMLLYEHTMNYYFFSYVDKWTVSRLIYLTLLDIANQLSEVLLSS